MPGVLQWLSTKLNCSSQVASLLAATASGDVEVVRGVSLLAVVPAAISKPLRLPAANVLRALENCSWPSQ